MIVDKEHEYAPVDLDDDGLNTTTHPRRRIATWRLVIYIELAHVLLFTLIYAGWHLTHRDPHYGMSGSQLLKNCTDKKST
jgi:hypothetical protein